MLHARLLTYLDEVARAGTIRRAAERLGVAASSINRQIIALEQDLGVALFERLPRRMRLTTAGELLIDHVRTTLREHDRVRVQLVELQGHRRGQVTLATMAGLTTSLLSGVVAWMRARHASVKLVITVLPHEAIVASVLAGDADLGLGYQLAPDPRLRVLARCFMRLGVVTAPGHPLTQRSRVTLADCTDHPMIIPDRSVTLGGIMADAFARNRIPLERAVETNAIELLKHAVLDGTSVTFLNELDVEQERRAGTLAFVLLPDGQLPRQELRLVQRARGGLDSAQSRLAEHLREVVQELAAGRPAQTPMETT